MKLSTTICLALVVALCYLVTVESSPIQKDDVSEKKNEVTARQSGPVVSPAVPGDADDDDDDDGKAFINLIGNHDRFDPCNVTYGR